MQSELTVEIARPIAEVFDFATNHVAEWSLTVVEDRVVEEQPDGVGTTFRVVTEEKGRRMEFDGVVTRHEPPVASSVVLRGAHFDIDVDYLFEDLGGRTRLTQRSKVTGKGFIKVMFFLFGWLMKRAGCKAQENELANLKRIMEAAGADA
jgi:hypothetical protein